MTYNKCDNIILLWYPRYDRGGADQLEKFRVWKVKLVTGTIVMSRSKSLLQKCAHFTVVEKLQLKEGIICTQI